MPSCNTYHLTWVSLNLGCVISLHNCSSKAQPPLLGPAGGRGVTPLSRCPWPLAVLAPLSLRPWHWMLGSSSPPHFCVVSHSQRVHLVKSMGFPVIMYGCESWTIKKTEHWRIDAFELLCWRRLLRVPWTAKRSKQSIIKEIISESSLERLMLKLKLKYFGHLMWRTDSF